MDLVKFKMKIEQFVKSKMKRILYFQLPNFAPLVYMKIKRLKWRLKNGKPSNLFLRRHGRKTFFSMLQRMSKLYVRKWKNRLTESKKKLGELSIPLWVHYGTITLLLHYDIIILWVHFTQSFFLHRKGYLFSKLILEFLNVGFCNVVRALQH